GAVLFPPGDAGALAAAVAAVLAAGRGEEPAPTSPRAAIAPWDAGDGPGGIEALLRTYREVACAAR
ncbi:MAG TPA: hypothetical protein VM599_05720, partial [Thermoanaerobaculia bacterium]|nr:hypothetical protein [Thermoanaerobaculia bacterium]